MNGSKIVSPGQTILVCDIGGGTSDFSLIHVRSGEDGRLQFHRVAVGDHLLLGGDNLDLALAHFVEQKIANGGRLDPRQWSMLIPACRHAKEILLGANAPETHTVVLSGSGSRLIGGAMQTELSRDDVLKLFVDGFLPTVALDEKPQKRQSGFQEFGLPYAADPAITKYLATFLQTHSQDSVSGSRPDIVLFNGGFFASPVLRTRLIESLGTMVSHDRMLIGRRLNFATIVSTLLSPAVRRISAWFDAESAFGSWRGCLAPIISGSNRPTDSERPCVWWRPGPNRHQHRR